MQLDKKFIDNLLEAPDSQMDKSCKPIIKSWDYNADALDILFLIDKIKYFALASEFVVLLFVNLLANAIKEERLTKQKLEKMKNWTEKDLSKNYRP